MSTGTTASLWLTLLSVVLSVSDGQINIPAVPGKNATLTCTTPNKEPVTVVEWRRTDLKTDEYVLLYRDEKLDPENQHPSYKNRVDLQDRQMKDGNVSLILINVTTADSGTYECYVETKTNRRKRAVLDSDPISIIRLDVVPPGHKDGPVGLIICLTVAAAAAVVVGFLIFRRRRHPGPYHPPPDPGPQQL